jgi:pimeloyl-ACP methyl ester carboxylesterase
VCIKMPTSGLKGKLNALWRRWCATGESTSIIISEILKTLFQEVWLLLSLLIGNFARRIAIALEEDLEGYEQEALEDNLLEEEEEKDLKRRGRRSRGRRETSPIERTKHSSYFPKRSENGRLRRSYSSVSSPKYDKVFGGGDSDDEEGGGDEVVQQSPSESRVGLSHHSSFADIAESVISPRERKRVSPLSAHKVESMKSVHPSLARGQGERRMLSSDKRLSLRRWMLRHGLRKNLLGQTIRSTRSWFGQRYDKIRSIVLLRQREVVDEVPVGKDDVHEHEKSSTGLMEDFYNSSLVLIDRFCEGVPFLFRLRYDLFVKHVWSLGRELHLSKMISHANVDDRSIPEIIHREGYPIIEYSVVSEDGYILEMTRIPRLGSRNAVFLQHGVFDCSFSWVGHGAMGSLAFRLWDAGYDVFLGNFRGTGKRLHTKPDISRTEYWDFNMNHHAFYDVGGFVDEIHRIKSEEFKSGEHAAKGGLEAIDVESGGMMVRQTRSRNQQWTEIMERVGDVSPSPGFTIGGISTSSPGGEGDAPSVQSSSVMPSGESDDHQPFRIVAVAHSMGALACISYLLRRRMSGKSHHLSRMILLSPAGYHETAPRITHIGPLLDVTYAKLFCSWQFPSERWRIFASKFIQDIRSSPDLRRLVSVIVSRFVVGGGDATQNPFVTIHNVVYNTMSGTSIGVYHHFRQIYDTTKFEMFDYGTAGNLAHYGLQHPPDYFDFYQLIDIPVFFCAGKRDSLIPPVNVAKHYDVMQRHRPDLAHYTLFEGSGHVDFTLGMNAEVVSFILSNLPR